MNEDQWLALAKSQQDASYREGWNAAKAEYVPVLMEHLRILADLRAGVEALLKESEKMRWERDAWMSMAYRDVLALFDGGSE